MKIENAIKSVVKELLALPKKELLRQIRTHETGDIAAALNELKTFHLGEKP